MTIRLANVTATPFALHLDRGVVVIGAHDHIECREEDLAVGQVNALCNRGVLVAHREPPLPDTAEEKTAKRPRKRPTRRTRR